jgi:hypothetical protein
MSKNRNNVLSEHHARGVCNVVEVVRAGEYLKLTARNGRSYQVPIRSIILPWLFRLKWSSLQDRQSSQSKL